MNEGEIVIPTNQLEFVMRNGRMILQQLFEVQDMETKEKRREWRDVPVNRTRERAA